MRLGSSLEVQNLFHLKKMKMKYFLIFSNLIFFSLGARPDEDHPRIHFPKRADTSHEGKNVTSYMVDTFMFAFILL